MKLVRCNKVDICRVIYDSKVNHCYHYEFHKQDYTCDNDCVNLTMKVKCINIQEIRKEKLKNINEKGLEM